MACPAVITGDAFVTRVLLHIDCQAQYLGSYGYQSLAQPGSTAAILVSGLLTLFVALWGLRLLVGPAPGARDVVMDVLKIGIVLTLAFSWPAFRTVIHDVVLNGPAEIASSMSNPGLATTGAGLVERLQGVDDAIVTLTESGTGRRSGQYIDNTAPGATFEASALEDESALGWSRLSFLVGMFGALALLRLAAGLLLAMAPLAAALLLFDFTRGLFGGWVRGLVFVTAGAVALTVSIALELAILEPWLADALRVRELGYATPAAPIELLAMTLAFAVVHLGIMWVVARISFYGGWVQGLLRPAEPVVSRQETIRHDERRPAGAGPGRAEAIASHLDTRVRIERSGGYQTRMPDSSNFRDRDDNGSRAATFGGAPLPAPANGRSAIARRIGPSSMRRGAGL